LVIGFLVIQTFTTLTLSNTICITNRKNQFCPNWFLIGLIGF
jgi:hypothetical protein